MQDSKMIRITVEDWEFIKIAAMHERVSMTQYISSMVKKVNQLEESQIEEENQIEKLWKLVDGHSAEIKALRHDMNSIESDVDYHSKRINDLENRP